MSRKIYHFIAERSSEDLYLNSNHKLSGHIIQYLKNFQIDGIKFLHQNFELNRSCILNDDNGLGKTMQVTAFLDAVLPYKNTNKKCLIIVKDENRITNWKFHLDIFTKFCVKVAYKKEDVGNENIYLTKWNSLLKTTTLADVNFDYIIVDNRDGLLSNKFCLNHLLKNYRNKISLFISSSDITIDLELFHKVLKLCGLLNDDYVNLKNFENKFSLPSCKSKNDKDIFEAYFIRREKIINFCRDFRLRRYRYQLEDQLPLTTLNEYKKSIESWEENGIKVVYSSSDSDSIKILISSSSSDRNTEDLFNAFFTTKEERKLNKENSKENDTIENLPLSGSSGDVEMSPLLFESDTEDKILEQQNPKDTENVSRLRSDEKYDDESKPLRAKKINKKSKSNAKKENFIRFTRRTSGLFTKVTRSMAHKNKYLISDITENLKRIDNIKQRKNIKRRFKKRNTNEIENKNNERQTDLSKIEENIKNFHNEILSSDTYDFKIDLLNKSEIEKASDIQIISPNPTDDDLIILSNSIEETVKQNRKSYEIDQTIFETKTKNPSPDLFMTNNRDDYEITCTQKHGTKKQAKNHNNSSNNIPTKSCLIMLEKNLKYKTNENGRKTDKNTKIAKENLFMTRDNDNKNENKKNDNEISNTSANNMLISQCNKNQTDSNRINKITKYFSSNSDGGTDSSMNSEDNLTFFENTKNQNNKSLEFNYRTPKRQKLLHKSSLSSTKKSPKICNFKSDGNTSNNRTPNGLTKWLIRSPSSSSTSTNFIDDSEKNTRRRRLDISFQGL